MRISKLGILAIGAMILHAGEPSNSIVALGGAGPAPYFEEALDKIADTLTSAGVKIKVLSGEPRARTALLDEMKERGYGNLLYVTLDAPRESRTAPSRGAIIGSCFVDGKRVWEEESRGSLVVPRGVESEIKSMLNGIAKKIAKHAGGSCLPR